MRTRAFRALSALTVLFGLALASSAATVQRDALARAGGAADAGAAAGL